MFKKIFTKTIKLNKLLKKTFTKTIILKKLLKKTFTKSTKLEEYIKKSFDFDFELIIDFFLSFCIFENLFN